MIGERQGMTKTLGEIQPPKQITNAEREAHKAFRQVDPKAAMSEHEIVQKAFSQNRERLKTERLAREAASTPPPQSQGEKQVDTRVRGQPTRSYRRGLPRPAYIFSERLSILLLNGPEKTDEYATS